MDSIKSAGADQSIAAQLEISFDGRRFTYRQYRYDHFSDAVNYARIDRNRPGFVRNEGFMQTWSQPLVPSTEDTQRMKPYGISFSDGRYIYGIYRYDQLEQAIAYASRGLP